MLLQFRRLNNSILDGSVYNFASLHNCYLRKISKAQLTNLSHNYIPFETIPFYAKLILAVNQRNDSVDF